MIGFILDRETARIPKYMEYLSSARGGVYVLHNKTTQGLRGIIVAEHLKAKYTGQVEGDAYLATCTFANNLVGGQGVIRSPALKRMELTARHSPAAMRGGAGSNGIFVRGDFSLYDRIFHHHWHLPTSTQPECEPLHVI